MSVYRTSAGLIVDGADNVNAPVLCVDNLVTTSNVAVTAAAAGYPASNMANPATFLRWQSAGTGANNIDITLGGQNANYIGIANHNFGTAGRQVRILANVGAGLYQVIAPFTPTDDRPLLFLFAKLSYTALRVEIGSGSAVAKVAVIYAGTALAAQRNIYVGHDPITLGVDQEVANGRSESGKFLGRFVTQERRTTRITLTDLTPDWVRDDLEPFLQQARERPFFWGWRPNDYADVAGYVWLTNRPQPVNSRANGMMEVTLEVVGQA